jgi:hypothetical protein
MSRIGLWKTRVAGVKRKLGLALKTEHNVNLCGENQLTVIASDA